MLGLGPNGGRNNGKREHAIEAAGGGSIIGKHDSEGGALKKVISPDRRHQAVEQTIESIGRIRVAGLPGIGTTKNHAALQQAISR
jgi:hypothetical protein